MFSISLKKLLAIETYQEIRNDNTIKEAFDAVISCLMQKLPQKSKVCHTRLDMYKGLQIGLG